MQKRGLKFELSIGILLYRIENWSPKRLTMLGMIFYKLIKVLILSIGLLLIFIGCEAAPPRSTSIQNNSQEMSVIKTISETPKSDDLKITPTIRPVTLENATLTGDFILTQEITPVTFSPDCLGYYMNSPDQKWSAVSCGLDGPLRIRNIAGSKKWEIPYGTAMIEDTSVNIEYQPYYWSRDSHYLYFRPYICCWDGPSLNGYPHNLSKINIENGEITEIAEGGWNYSFSPRDRYLAYFKFSNNDHKLVVLNLESGTSQNYRLRNAKESAFIKWSPNENLLAFTSTNGHLDSESIKYWIELVNRDTGELIEITEESDYFFEACSFIENNSLSYSESHELYPVDLCSDPNISLKTYYINSKQSLSPTEEPH
jgi:hypothetical protein